jgi:hypothetical protein
VGSAGLLAGLGCKREPNGASKQPSKLDVCVPNGQRQAKATCEFSFTVS